MMFYPAYHNNALCTVIIYCKYDMHKGTLYVSVQISCISVITLLRKTILQGIKDRRVTTDIIIDKNKSYLFWYDYFFVI